MQVQARIGIMGEYHDFLGLADQSDFCNTVKMILCVSCFLLGVPEQLLKVFKF